MNFKLKTLVAAVVLSASATSANALIDSNSGNSELVFSAWDSVLEVGYTYDLNWDKFLTDFIGADATVNAAGNATVLANAKVGASMIGAGGVIFDDVLTGLPFSSNLANVQWNLGAYDNISRYRMLTTKDSLSVTPFASTTNQLRAAVNGFNGYAAASDSFVVGGNSVVDGYALTIAADGGAYAGNFGSGWVNNLADITNALGDQSFLYMLATPVLGSSNAQMLQTQVLATDGSQIVARTYQQAGQWRLNISAVSAPIPEPETYAMLLAGLGLMGAVARRRSNKSA